MTTGTGAGTPYPVRWKGDTRRMQISWAIPCRYAEQSNGLGTLVGAGFDVFYLESLPADLQVVLAVNTLVPEHELGTDHSLTMEILDPGMHATPGPTMTIHLDDYPRRPGGRQPSALEIVPLQLRVDQHGQYTINLRLGDRVTSVPIFVLPPQ